MNHEAKENRTHRDHTVNPRKWPHGTNRVPANSRGPAMQRVVDGVKGMALLGDWERELIYHLPTIGGPGDYANLGHSQGASAVLFASSLIDNGIAGEVYSVDLFNPHSILRRALRRLALFPQAAERIHLQIGATDEIVKLFCNHSFRGIFVDADHCYESVKKDAENWSRLVGKGGVICFHDVHQDFSHRAIEETVGYDANFTERLDLHIETIRVWVRQ